MFGKPNWFRPKTFGWGLTPITWQGWAYTAVWGGLLVAPFSLLSYADVKKRVDELWKKAGL